MLLNLLQTSTIKCPPSCLFTGDTQQKAPFEPTKTSCRNFNNKKNHKGALEENLQQNQGLYPQQARKTQHFSGGAANLPDNVSFSG